MSAEEVFEEFKTKTGAKINDILKENKALLRARKQSVRQVAAEMNKLKTEIDQKQETIREKQSYFDGEDYKPSSSQTTAIIDEDSFEIMLELKQLKKKYRELSEELTALNKDVEYISKLITDCRERLLSEFRIWYQGLGGSVDNIDLSSLDKRATTPSSPSTSLSVLQFPSKARLQSAPEEDDSAPFKHASSRSAMRLSTSMSTASLPKRGSAAYLPSARFK